MLAIELFLSWIENDVTEGGEAMLAQVRLHCIIIKEYIMIGSKEEDSYSVRDILITIKSFSKYLLRKWWVLLLCIMIGASLGAGYYFLQKPRYEALTSFILEEKSGSGGGLAGLASQFGMDMGSLGMSGGSLFAGDNIFEILKSKKIIFKVLLSKTSQIQKPQVTLADLFLEFSGWKKAWSKRPELAELNYSNVVSETNLTSQQDSTLNLIQIYLVRKALMAERKNKKGSIITVTLAAANPLFARLFSERVVEEATVFYLDVKTKIAQTNINQMQRRADSLLYLLNRKSYTVASTQLLDVNPGFKAAGVPAEIAGRDKMVLSTIYVEVTKNLEASKLLLSQQTPIVQILDRPDELLTDKKTSLPTLTAIMAFGALFFIVLFLLGRFIFRFN